MTLFIALPPPHTGDVPAGQYRYATSADGTTLTAQGTAPLAVLPRGAGETVAVVPASALSWHAVRLPQLPRGTSAARLRSVLEGLLEEHLLDDPSTLHFALAPGRHTGQSEVSPVWIACCNKAWLTSQLQVLEQAGLPAARLLPAQWPRPAGALPDLLLAGEPDQPVLLASSANGVWQIPVRSQQAFEQALAQCAVAHPAPAASDAPDTDGAVEPSGPVLHTEPAVSVLAEKWHGAPVPLRTLEQNWLAAHATDFDLAQFDLRLSGGGHVLRRWRKVGTRLLHAPEWRAARVGLVVLVAAQLIGLNAWAWIQQRQLQATRADIQTLLTQTYPHVRAIVDAPLQMEQETDRLRHANGQATRRDAETLLQALASALPTTQRLERLAFSAGELQFNTRALSAEALEDAQARLQSFGLLLRPAANNQYTLTVQAAP